MKKIVVLATGQAGWCFPSGPARRFLVDEGKPFTTADGHPQGAAVCDLLVKLGARPTSVDTLESEGCFVLVILADIADGLNLEALRQQLAVQGEAVGLALRVQREDVFLAMHRI